MEEDTIGDEIIVDVIHGWTEAVENERRVRSIHDGLDPWVPGLGTWIEEHDIEIVAREGGSGTSVRVKSQQVEGGLPRIRTGFSCVDPDGERRNGIHTNPLRLTDHLRNVQDGICD